MASTPTMISRVRTAIDDVAGDKSVFKENLTRSITGNQVGGGNTSFQLNNKRIVATTLLVSKDGGAYAAPATEDDAKGRFTLSVAPTSSLFATYDFQFFTDTEITSFLTQAVDFVGAADVASVPDGLLDTLALKAGSDACFALSSRVGMLYDASAGGKQASKGDLSKKYRDLAKDLFERAVAERKAYYGERKGKASSPSFGQFATKQTPYTPRR